ncbi:MAG TPA: hypothetical protein VGX76_25185, partial [Pirellulales bacterium]|nr:hypothetical protein [Pirellulales bacterium]
MAILLVTICGCWGSSPPAPSPRPDSQNAAEEQPLGTDKGAIADRDGTNEAANARDELAADTQTYRETAVPTDTSANEAVRDEIAGEETARDENPHEETPPDETLFRGWPQPKFALVCTGEELGYIEPCGCSGLENQKGGLRRRHTLLKQFRAKGWPVVALDNGGLINRSGRQSEIKFEKTAEALASMGYSAVGFGTADLKLQGGSVMAVLANFPPERNPFVSANVGVLGFDDNTSHRFLLIEEGPARLGVTAVLGDKFQKQINNDEISFLPAQQGLSEAYEKLEQAHCEAMVLLAHATPEESTDLAGQFPAFDVVVTAGGADEPPHVPTVLNGGKTLLIEVGHKGMYAVVLGFYDDEETPVRYQRVPIDKRFTDSPEMDEVMDSYQEQLQQMGWEGLDLRRKNHPAGKFAGSSACAE